MRRELWHRERHMIGWSGLERIRDLCRDYGVVEPIVKVSENWVTATFKRRELQPESGRERLEKRVLSLLVQFPMAMSEIARNLEQKSVSGQLKKVIRSLLDGKLIEYTIPEKPNSRLQKYRITEKGKKWLEE